MSDGERSFDAEVHNNGLCIVPRLRRKRLDSRAANPEITRTSIYSVMKTENIYNFCCKMTELKMIIMKRLMRSMWGSALPSGSAQS